MTSNNSSVFIIGSLNANSTIRSYGYGYTPTNCFDYPADINPRDMQGCNALWIFDSHFQDIEDYSSLIPENLGDTFEFIFSISVTPRQKYEFSEPFDIAERKTRYVVCENLSFSRQFLPGMTLPIVLNRPSPYLKELRLIGFPVTQTLLDNAAASPNLERIVISQPFGAEADDPVRSIPSPANQDIKTWAFDVEGVENITGWEATSLETLILFRAQAKHIPAGLLRSRELFHANFSCNLLDREAVTDVLEAISPKLCLLALNRNQIDDIPTLPDRWRGQVCFHNPYLVFKDKYKCLCYMDMSLNGFYEFIGQNPRISSITDYNAKDKTNFRIPAEMRENYHPSSRTCIHLAGNPFVCKNYPNLEGIGESVKIDHRYSRNSVVYHTSTR